MELGHCQDSILVFRTVKFIGILGPTSYALLVFLPSQDRVIGILDWELSTLGNQMCDVAYSCMVCTIYTLF